MSSLVVRMIYSLTEECLYLHLQPAWTGSWRDARAFPRISSVAVDPVKRFKKRKLTKIHHNRNRFQPTKTDFGERRPGSQERAKRQREAGHRRCSVLTWVAMPTGHVFRWHFLIIVHPRTIKGAVEKPNSSAPRMAATTTSNPAQKEKRGKHHQFSRRAPRAGRD